MTQRLKAEKTMIEIIRQNQVEDRSEYLVEDLQKMYQLDIHQALNLEFLIDNMMEQGNKETWICNIVAKVNDQTYVQAMDKLPARTKTYYQESFHSGLESMTDQELVGWLQNIFDQALFEDEMS